MSANAIEVRGLGKSFDVYARPFDRVRELLSLRRKQLHETVWALKEVDFSVPTGTACGLIGKNGAGKSTTLKILAGKQSATEGGVEVQGRVSSILELGTGFQDALTGRENAKINALFVGHDPWAIERQIEGILEFAELKEYADRPLGTYSSGMKARLAFSVLTCLDPEVLLLDEALATGDAGFARKCQTFLRKLATSGCTTILASHDLSFLVNTCQQLVWLDKGRVRMQGNPVEVAQAYVQDLGNEGATAQRPRNVLFRFQAPESGAEVEFEAHAVEWEDEAGEPLASFYLGQAEAFEGLVSTATELGLTPESARRGWGAGEVRLVDNSLNRRLRPHEGPGGAAFLAVPLPEFPDPLPAGVRVHGNHELAEGIRVSVFYDGGFHALGEIGADPKRIDGSAWFPVSLDLAKVLSPASGGGA